MTGSDRDVEFGAFVGARSAALLRTAYLVTGHRQSAEDLLQTALAKTYLAWNRIDSPESVEAYVRRVMVTTHVSWWRKHKGREQTTDPQVDADDPSERPRFRDGDGHGRGTRPALVRPARPA